ncbi:MAG: Glucosyltransferase MdoH, partial [Chromatiaceae bacterium]|nr:Glucosyltransferase MdoH [Chromatiaceae bacterium]
MSLPPPVDYSARRLGFALLVAATVLGGIALMAATLAGNGFDVWDAAVTACFALTLPWTAVGFWNAVIGLALMRLAPAPPETNEQAPPTATIRSRTAILSCIRNEDTETVARNLDRMIAGLAATSESHRFEVWVLSDSTWPECIDAEEAFSARLQARWGHRVAVHYRRRSDNAGYKAGNIQDFVTRHGDGFDFALVLDADSLMAAQTIRRLVRAMESNPRLGILQTLVVGLPSVSAFARPFQFGMRLGMRSYTLGSAWWQGDCGPYWGHNALIRVAPFREHCELPLLPGRPPLGGHVLSHDQVEAVLMRRAGFEVRVLPFESGSFEENPPTLLEFIRRDLRWCQGNLQYLKLLGLPGLRALSRVQLGLAILMFLSSPAWVSLMVLGVLRLGLARDTGEVLDPALGSILFALIMTMVFAPKLAALADLLLSAAQRRAFGGATRVLAGVVTEVVFFTLLAPVMAIAHTVFMAGLPFGRAVVWGPQRRFGYRVSARDALRRLWPQTLLGLAAFLWLAASV